MQNRPKLRFKEYNDEWSNTTLGDVCAIYDGTHQTPDYKECGVQFLSVENIKDIDASNKFISEEDFRRDFKIKPEVNDILMTRIGDIGTPALVKTNKDYAYYVSLALLKCKKDILPSYLLQAIVEDNFQRQLWKNTLHVAFPKKINKGDIGKCKIKHPSLQEQQKIAEFLSKVDEVIAEREAEVKDLEQKKKGLMQKLFSQQLRFTDSNNQPYPEWETYLLKDLLEKIIDNRGKTPPLSDKGYPLLEIASMVNNRISYNKISKYVNQETYNKFFRGYIEFGDVLFSTVGFYAGEVSFYDKQIDCTIAQNIVGLRFKQEKPLFMTYLLSEPKNKKRIKAIEMNQAQPSIKVTQLIELTFSIPCLEEQEKIANVLSKLDELIEEKKALLSDWQQFKKGLLQQMFV